MGRYTVLSRLGAGGMGVVYMAYDPELDRRVALKLLHPAARGVRGRARARLIREAQALAKLAHPNVVAVFDVGEHAEEVWLAMEFIEGGTLSAWVKQARPRSRERLRVLLDAGRGVAAAHAAGLVHRDLKPANVMVGDDGRVRVMDFGLARTPRDTDSESDAGQDAGSSDARSDRPQSPAPLTQTRDVLGTPAYMAPEQWNGGDVDAAADQFSFCVMAWELLYGERPFGNQPMAALAGDRLADPPRRASGGCVPRWVRKILARGLSRDPERRWPSMEALIQHAERRQTRRRLSLVTAVLSGLFLLGITTRVVGVVSEGRRRAACDEAAAELDSLWPARAPELSAALQASDADYVRRLEGTLLPTLDRWSADWRRTRSEVCEASTIDDTMSPLDARKVQTCLQTQREAVSTVLDLLVEGDVGALLQAPFMASSMPRGEECLERQWLDAIPLVLAEGGESIRQAPRRWLRARALQDAGRYEEAMQEADALLEQARARGWPPLSARALLLQGTINTQLGHYRGAEGALREAYFLAGGSEVELVAATAAAHLVELVGVNLAQPEGGLEWAAHARMMMERVGDRAGPQRLVLLDGEAKVRRLQGDYEQAEALFEQALALRRESLGDDHPAVALTLRELATVHTERSALEEAEALDRQALELLEQGLGPDHPEVARTLHNLATVLALQGERAQARQLFERGYEVLERTLGPDHPDLALLLHALAVDDTERGQLADARRRHERALAIRERALRPDHPRIAESLMELANLERAMNDEDAAAELYARAIGIMQRSLGTGHPRLASPLSALGSIERTRRNYADSERLFEQAIDIQTRAYGPEHAGLALSFNNLAFTAFEQGDLSRAVTLYRRARTLMEQSLGPDHETVAYPTLGLADVALAQGEPAAAVRLCERALSMLDPQHHRNAVADGRFILARARWSLGDRRPAVVALAREAAQVYRERGTAGQPSLTAVEAWLAERDSSVKAQP